MSPRTVDGHEIPALTVDTVILHDNEVLLIQRRSPPFVGAWALPGGFVEHGETVEAAAVREAKEETGITVRLTRLLGVYSAPDRDPRHHTVSVVFMAEPSDPRQRDAAKGGSDADAARWFPLDKTPELAFDHEKILADARKTSGTPSDPAQNMTGTRS